ncbi:COL11A1.2 family protein [Megaselia abdita]
MGAPAKGFCGDNRNIYQVHKYPAYTLTKDAILTIATQQVFPEGFPQDFSLLFVLKPSNYLNRASIFTIYSENSEDVLSVTIGPTIGMVYHDSDATLEQRNEINFDIGISDTNWHRIAISVKDNTATLILDCDKQVTRSLERKLGGSIATNGLIVSGIHLSNAEGFFTGDIQMIAIMNSTEASYNLCNVYAPDCNMIQSDQINYPKRRNSSWNDQKLNDGTNINNEFDSRSHSIGGGGMNGYGVDKDPDYLGYDDLDVFNSLLTTPKTAITKRKKVKKIRPGQVSSRDLFEINNQDIEHDICPPGLRGPKGEQGPKGDNGLRGEAGRDGIPGRDGISGPPGNVFMLQMLENNEKGPDGGADAVRQILAQHSLQMRGPEGPMGLTGPPGPRGIHGDIGPKGIPGDAGEPGFQGPRGPTGSKGAQGRHGSRGRDGERGLTGQKGQKGEDGKMGSPGLPGPKGHRGASGEKGDQGLTGERGLQGDQGPTGLQGGPGESGIRGFPGPRGFPGSQGLPGLPGKEGSVGPLGVDGPPGFPGMPGPEGREGPVGAPGPRGDMGQPGQIGPQGKQGIQGLPGPEGQPGPTGKQGKDGSKGHSGLPGASGPIGFPGSRGEKGEEGPSGPQGDKGEKGQQGIDGEKGDMGIQGERGPIGLQGLQGVDGPEGPKGDSGLQGEAGPVGPRGEKGNRGLTGI